MIIVVIGRSGEGKSVYSYWRAYYDGPYKQVIVWDASAAYHGNVVSSPEQFVDAIEARNYEQPIIIQPDPEKLEEEFDQYILTIRKTVKLKSFSLVIDEGGTEIQNAWKQSPQLRALLNEHREGRRDTLIIINTHFLSDLAKPTKGLANELVIFRTTDAGTLDTLADMGVPDEALEHIRQLPKHHAIVYYFERQEGEQYKVLDNPAEWCCTLGLGATGVEGGGVDSDSAPPKKSEEVIEDAGTD